MITTHLLQVTDLKHIKVRPILLKKGGVKLAIYGLSHVKDERLHRLLRENKVIFTNIKSLQMITRPGVDKVKPKGWFKYSSQID